MQTSDRYFQNLRQDMLPYVPATSQKVLEVGCGEGHFAELIKKRYQAEVWGIECNPAAASKAMEKIDQVLTGDVNGLIDKIHKKYFDCIVFNDVIEHLVDPFSVLGRVRELLTDGGVIVLSVPNVLYVVNLFRLIILKDWNYTEQGILDITHLRFFTKKSLKNMLQGLGYKIVSLQGINPYKGILFPVLNCLTFGYFDEIKYLQFACVVRPGER